MLGKQIRGYQHLMRSVGISQPTTSLISTSNGRVCVVDFLKANETTIYMFHNMGSRWGDRMFYETPRDLTDGVKDIFAKLQAKYPCVSCYRDTNDIAMNGIVEIILLPENFNQLFENVIGMNRKLFSSVIGKYCNEQDPIAHYFFNMTHDAPNLLVWALTNYYKNGVSNYLISHILRWQNTYPQLVKKLTKGTITAYNGRDNVDVLYNEMISLRREKRTNDVFNMFNTAQKRLLKKMELTDDVLNACSAFNRLSLTKKINFVRKMSTVECTEEIIKQMKLLSRVQFDWNKASLLEFVANASENGLDCEIVYDNANLLMFKVNNYDTIKYLAKTTNWCISKNKKYWNDYMYHRNPCSAQYVLFDFDKKEDDEYSIVGFTTAPSLGITNAHSFTNKNMVQRDINRGYSLSSFMPKIFSIETFLEGHKIPSRIFNTLENSPFEWTKQGFLDFLEYAVGEDSFDVLSDNGNLLCVAVSHENVRFVLGKTYVSRFGTPNSSTKHIIFLNFNKAQDDASRLYFGQVCMNERSEEQVGNMYDATMNRAAIPFNALLTMYGLPYNTIARVYDKISVFKNALQSFDIITVGEYLKDSSIKYELTKKHSKLCSAMYEFILSSMVSLRSFDVIDLIYNQYNLKLTDVLRPQQIDDLLGCLMSDLRHFGTQRRGRNLPTEDEMSAFYANAITDERDAVLCGTFHFLNIILDNENDPSIVGSQIAANLCDCSNNETLSKFFVKKLYRFMSFENLTDTNYNYLVVVAKFQVNDIIDNIVNSNANESVLRKILERLPKTSDKYGLIMELLEAKTPKVESTAIYC